MISETVEASDGHAVTLYRMSAEGPARGLIHIAHGMGEHAARYKWTMERLAAAGFSVTANDHRAHGRGAQTLGDFGEDGVNRTVQDLHEILSREQQANPELPLILLGHSMGAMLSQMYFTRHGKTLSALVLSGTPGRGNAFMGWLSHTIARFERWRHGDTGESPLLQSLLFGSSNKAFEDIDDPTGFEWLSRDRDEVRLYVDDPLCGFVPNPRGLCDLFAAERANWRDESLSQLPADVPVYLFVGTEDPVHGELKNVKRLLTSYRSRGVVVTTHYYPGGRHEMLNETNRDEVMGDLLNWLNQVVPAGGSQSQGAASSP